VALPVVKTNIEIPYRIAVDSSAITSIGFKGNVLEIEFNSGNVYQYNGVTAATFYDFLNSESKGKFFNLYIKGNYDVIRIK
jgi:hypothetical protein